jgi:fructokinase
MAETEDAMTRMRIGIDLGGTKTEIIVLDAGGNVRLRRREATPFNDYRAIIELVARLVFDADRA